MTKPVAPSISRTRPRQPGHPAFSRIIAVVRGDLTMRLKQSSLSATDYFGHGLMICSATVHLCIRPLKATYDEPARAIKNDCQHIFGRGVRQVQPRPCA
jgi:hypothetical protein